MKLSEEAKKDLSGNEAFDNLIKNKNSLLEMLASDGYKSWLEWSKLQMRAWEVKAIRASSAEEREEARVYFLAFEKFCEMPLFLGALLQEEVSSDVAPE